MRKIKKEDIYRIIDANFNRSKEALRVVEDIFRFVVKDIKFFHKIRRIRHELSEIFGKKLVCKFIQARVSSSDLGKEADVLELDRKGIDEILFSNLQRSKESLRVLEELFKLVNKEKSKIFKKYRFIIYELEKEIIFKRAPLRDSR